MVRTPDRFWAHVVEINDGCKKCKYCDHIYAHCTLVSRVKYHLSGLRRAGVKICDKVPEDVREAARAAIDGPPEKNLKTTASSSNNKADNVTIPASLTGQNSEAEDGMGDRSPTALQPTDPECRWMSDDVLMNDERNMTREPEQTIVVDGFCEDLHHATGGEARGQQNNEVNSGMTDCAAGTLEWLQRHIEEIVLPNEVSLEDLLENTTNEPEQTIVRDGSREGLQHATGDEARGDEFPTPKLVGGKLEENKNVIWSWLMKNEISLIGIYGMGGVGKTTLMKHIHNQLLDKHVYWVTVSQDFSIYRLQSLIAKRINLDLSNEDDESHRAAKLSRELAGRQNYVLILDDLWNHFEPEEIGIPSKMDGCKLIITTRSLDVCRRMGCEGNVIKLEPLSKEEAWNLFKMELGNYDTKLEHLAKSVADECDGLPLGIKTMARSMRGVNDERVWRNTLEELKESRVRPRDMEPEVFRILRYSFLHLNDSKLQQCLLYCALFPEDHKIVREKLIELLIAERIIEGRKRRQDELNKGHDMLKQLEDACLLESATEPESRSSAVMMHDLVRDMALKEMREKSNVIVEAGEHLKELPDEENWVENLVRVSLIGNVIQEIPSSHSPRCPNLLTLLLSGNNFLKSIGDSFFKQMQKLKVLDLSHTFIRKLPDSISDLVTLTTLLLGGCFQLTHVPSLGKLEALKKLDLHQSRALQEVPRGLGLLSSLKYLDLSWTGIREFPAGILPKLYRLQVLRLDFFRSSIKVKAEELACLRKLEILVCHFVDLLAFKKYLKELDHDKKETQLPSTFDFLIGDKPPRHSYNFFERNLDRVICLYGQEINRRDVWLLPVVIEELAIDSCSDMKSLCDFYPSQHETELKRLFIFECQSMECLVSFSQMAKTMLGTIEDLNLSCLEGLHSLYSKEGATPTPLLPGNDIFTHLKIFKIYNCPKLETLFPPGLLSNLQNLEEFEVSYCSNLEKISEDESNVSSSNLAIEFSLPKLRILKLNGLPSLMSIGCGKLICNSVQEIIIIYCGRLKRLPFSCAPQTLKVIKAFPKRWWESVEWDEKNDYTVQLI